MSKVRKIPALKSREVVFCVINITISLLLGAYIYVRVSPDSYFGNWFCAFFSISKINTNNKVWVFLRNWGGDFLWAYAFFFSAYISMRAYPNALWCPLVFTMVFSVLIESLQLIQIDFLKCGTFDVLDIVIELFAVCIGAINLYCYLHINKRKEESS